MRRKLPGAGGTLPTRAILYGAFATLFGALSGPVLAQGDAEAGRLKADTCMGCHGIPGYTTVYPTYHVPKLGGQHAESIVAALQAYKAGERDHDTMHAQAETLSSKDMADIAAYFASIKGNTGTAQASTAKKGQ
jgi:cytochrome c553